MTLRTLKHKSRPKTKAVICKNDKRFKMSLFLHTQLHKLKQASFTQMIAQHIL